MQVRNDSTKMDIHFDGASYPLADLQLSHSSRHQVSATYAPGTRFQIQLDTKQEHLKILVNFPKDFSQVVTATSQVLPSRCARPHSPSQSVNINLDTLYIILCIRKKHLKAKTATRKDGEKLPKIVSGQQHIRAIFSLKNHIFSSLHNNMI